MTAVSSTSTGSLIAWGDFHSTDDQGVLAIVRFKNTGATNNIDFKISITDCRGTSETVTQVVFPGIAVAFSTLTLDPTVWVSAQVPLKDVTIEIKSSGASSSTFDYNDRSW